MAILRQQTNFVEQLYNSGMLDEQEQEQLLEPVQKKERKLQRKGAVWRAPRIVDVGPRLHPPPQPPHPALVLLPNNPLPNLPSHPYLTPSAQS